MEQEQEQEQERRNIRKPEEEDRREGRMKRKRPGSPQEQHQHQPHKKHTSGLFLSYSTFKPFYSISHYCSYFFFKKKEISHNSQKSGNVKERDNKKVSQEDIIDVELDFFSPSFNPLKALYNFNLEPPRKIRPLDNLSEYEKRFIKKDPPKSLIIIHIYILLIIGYP